MLAIISPAKTLDFESEILKIQSTSPDFIPESAIIMKKLKSLSAAKIAKQMGVSEELAKMNASRYANWSTEFNENNSQPAILTYSGEVYRGIGNKQLNAEDIEFAQNHLRILSGLHGVLRPKDLIQPYRLEIGATMQIGKSKNLYAFWKEKVTIAINQAMADAGSSELINLASAEYSKVVDFSCVKGKIITPVFKDLKNGEYKVVNTWSKHARGLMAGFIIRNRINAAEGIKQFDRYQYNKALSNESEWVFTCDTNLAKS